MPDLSIVRAEKFVLLPQHACTCDAGRGSVHVPENGRHKLAHPGCAIRATAAPILARPTLLTDKFRKIRAAEEGRPAENRGIEFVVADVGIGAGFEQ